MSVKEKTAYIAEYYWLWILGIVGGAVLLGYMVYRANFTLKESWFYAVYANTTEDGGEGSQLWKDFEAYAGFDLTKKKLVMNAESYFDPSITGGTNNSYFQAFVALVESGDLDVITMRPEGIEALGVSGRLMDLTGADAGELGAQYTDRLIYALPYDTDYSTEPVPIGIDISDSLLVTRYHLYEGECAIGISAYSGHPESVRQFLKFILEEEA